MDEPLPVVAAQIVAEPQVVTVASNQDVVWNTLINSGFTAVQTAGIMGNLRQEHNFRTDGDGLAQWLGARLNRLLEKPNARSIEVQAAYLVEEMNTTESYAGNLLRQAQTIEDATIIFQDKVERCNPYYCMQSQRIQYAYEYYEQYQ